MDKETSSRVSSIAAKYIAVTVEDIFDESLSVEEQLTAAKLVADIRTLAGSVLSQDQTKGNQND